MNLQGQIGHGIARVRDQEFFAKASGSRASALCEGAPEIRKYTDSRLAPSAEHHNCFGVGTRWYAVQCQPHREQFASRQLRNQQFIVFLPTREKTRRHARKLERVRAPFFPGYLFVQLNLERDRWRSVNWTFGVSRLVANGDRPTAAPRGVVEALIAACDSKGLLAWEPNLELGQRVRVTNGPFADFMGEFEQMTDTGRVRVLLEILGGSTPVLLSRADITPVETRV